MTDQGKPSVCPTCGSARETQRTQYFSSVYSLTQTCPNPWHYSSPVPAATTTTDVLTAALREISSEYKVNDAVTRIPYGVKAQTVAREALEAFGANVSAPQAVPAATTAYGMVTHPKWPDPTWDTGIQNSENDLMGTSLVPEGIPESRVNSPFSNRVSAPQAESVPANEFCFECDTPDKCASAEMCYGHHKGYPRSVPAGKDAARDLYADARDWLANNQPVLEELEIPTGDRVNGDSRVEMLVNSLAEFAASETAALRAERDKLAEMVRKLCDSMVPHPKEHPTMYAAKLEAQKVLGEVNKKDESM